MPMRSGQHQILGAGQGLKAEGRELGAPTDAIEQRLAKFGLERPDAAAEGRLGQEQRRGRAAERAGLGERDQVPQLNQGHGGCSAIAILELMVKQETMHWTL
jgi:hypothetical protein